MRMFLLWSVVAVTCYGETGAIEKLAFMSGCWAGGGVEEVWLKPQGGTMIGMSRTVKGGRTISTEFLQISAGTDGVLVLTARPRLADQATLFRLLELQDGVVTFSNPDHDFPQRIIYRREVDGSLSARIEGKVGGKERYRDFKYARAAC